MVQVTPSVYRSKLEQHENWERMNARAEEIVDRTTRVKRKQSANLATRTIKSGGYAEGTGWKGTLECPFIPSDGSYEDFKILAETYGTDVKALIDLHRYAM